MNIAINLFGQGRIEECLHFTRLCLERAVAEKELERVGMALLVLARCQAHQQSDKWEDTCLQLLQNIGAYPPGILREALLTYSQLAGERGRLFEAEGYFMQAQGVEVGEGLEGLILPTYDFSY